MPPVPRRRWQEAAAGSPARPSACDRTRGSGHTRCPGLWAAHQPLSPGARATGSEEIRGRQRPRRATSCRTPGRTLCRQPRSAPSVRGAGLRAGRSAFPGRAFSAQVCAVVLPVHVSFRSGHTSNPAETKRHRVLGRFAPQQWGCFSPRRLRRVAAPCGSQTRGRVGPNARSARHHSRGRTATRLRPAVTAGLGRRGRPRPGLSAARSQERGRA